MIEYTLLRIRIQLVNSLMRSIPVNSNITWFSRQDMKTMFQHHEVFQTRHLNCFSISIFFCTDRSVKCSIKFNQHQEPCVRGPGLSPQSPILCSSGLAPSPHSQQQRPRDQQTIKGWDSINIEDNGSSQWVANHTTIHLAFLFYVINFNLTQIK